MHELLAFIGSHPVLSFAVFVVVVIAVLAARSEYLDRKHGDQ